MNKKGKCSQTEIAMHTHDIIAYKRCRRKWSMSSPFKRHLKKKNQFGVSSNLWFGSGIHFALEDYHGYNRFNDPLAAFDAYVGAHKPEERPDDAADLVLLGDKMLAYYIEWEKKHAKWKTVWVDGKPLVEEKFSLVLEPLSTDDQEIVYHGTFDRIVEDEHGDWWILDYKTAKGFDTAKLTTDFQISAYCWAASQWYEREIKGMIYLQMSKTPPKAPNITKTGVSAAKTQATTPELYKEALVKHYGEVKLAPKKCVDFLNDLMYNESEDGNNRFIRADFVERTYEQQVNTYEQIIAVGKEILNPELAIYPNPTRDCSWDCPFRDVCIAMDCAEDWEIYLEEFEVRPETMRDELPKWMLKLFTDNKEQYAEEYNQFCSEKSVDSVEDFINKYKED